MVVTEEGKHLFPYKGNFKQQTICKDFFTSVVKYLKGDKHNSLHLARKYARIFVLGHNLFLEAHSFHRALLSENYSHFGTDNVRGQIPALILALNKGYCLFSNWVDNVIVVKILVFYNY